MDKQVVRRMYRNGKIKRSSRLHTCVAALLLFLMAISLGACGSRSSSRDRIAAAGVLRVAIDPSFPPFESVDAQGQITGLDADLAADIAEPLGVDVQFVTTGYDALYDALIMQRADVIISALYPDPQRTADFAFSVPYFDAGDVLIVPQASSISTMDDLAGKTVLVIFGTAGHMEALRWQKRLAPQPVVLSVATPVTMTSALETHSVDALVLDRVSALSLISQAEGLQILQAPVSEEPYAIAARLEDRDLLDAIDAILVDLQSTGALDALIRQWLSD